jgi:hypothetical protein
LGKAVIGGIKAPLVNVQGGVVNVAGGIPGGGGLPSVAAAGGGLLGAVIAPAAAIIVGAIAAAAVSGEIARALNPNIVTPTNPTGAFGRPQDTKSPGRFRQFVGQKEVPVVVKNWNGLEDRLPARRIAQAGSPMAIIDRSSVAVTVNVTAGGIKKTVTSQSRYGPAAGSRDDPRFLGAALPGAI